MSEANSEMNDRAGEKSRSNVLLARSGADGLGEKRIEAKQDSDVSPHRCTHCNGTGEGAYSVTFQAIRRENCHIKKWRTNRNYRYNW